MNYAKAEAAMSHETPVFVAQCWTARIANAIAQDQRDATGFSGEGGLIDLCQQAPFCLRVVRERRTPQMQAFRDCVARVARVMRQGIREGEAE